MKLGVRAREDEETSHDEEEALESAPAAAAFGYRVAGDLEVRSKHLEQELAEAKARIRAMEREVFALRKVDRRRKAAFVTSRGGVGAMVASVAMILLYAFGASASPMVAHALVALGFVFGALLGMRGYRDDDDGFPPAPPPRFG